MTGVMSRRLLSATLRTGRWSSVAAAGAAVAVAVAGCGGDPRVSEDRAASVLRDMIDGSLQDAGSTSRVKQVTCARRDGNVFDCIVKATLLTVGGTLTCGDRNCTWRANA